MHIPCPHPVCDEKQPSPWECGDVRRAVLRGGLVARAVRNEAIGCTPIRPQSVGVRCRGTAVRGVSVAPITICRRRRVVQECTAAALDVEVHTGSHAHAQVELGAADTYVELGAVAGECRGVHQ